MLELGSVDAVVVLKVGLVAILPLTWAVIRNARAVAAVLTFALVTDGDGPLRGEDGRISPAHSPAPWKARA